MLKYYLGVGETKSHFLEEEELVMMSKNIWHVIDLLSLSFTVMLCLETWAGFRNFTVEIVIKVVTEIKDPSEDRIKSI